MVDDIFTFGSRQINFCDEYAKDYVNNDPDEEDDYDAYEDDYLFNYESDHCDAIPARVRVALQLLGTLSDLPNQISSIAYDTIVNYLTEKN